MTKYIPVRILGTNIGYAKRAQTELFHGNLAMVYQNVTLNVVGCHIFDVEENTSEDTVLIDLEKNLIRLLNSQGCVDRHLTLASIELLLSNPFNNI